MKVLVTGASGFVGRKVMTALLGEIDVTGTYCRNPVHGLPLVPLDVTDGRAVQRLFTERGFDACLHLAGIPPLKGGGAADRRSVAVAEGAMTMVEGTRNVAEACEANGTRLILVSTDQVFSPHLSSPPTEKDAPKPLNAFGDWKRAAEILVSRIVEDHLIVRVSSLYGAADESRDCFVARAVNRLSTGDTVLVDSTIERTPVLVDDLALLLKHTVSERLTGPLHVAPDEAVTDWAFTTAIARAYRYETTLVRPARDHASLANTGHRLGASRLSVLGMASPRHPWEALEALNPMIPTAA